MEKDELIRHLEEVIADIEACDYCAYFICNDFHNKAVVHELVGKLRDFGKKYVKGFDSINAFCYELKDGSEVDCITPEYKKVKIAHIKAYIEYLKNQNNDTRV